MSAELALARYRDRGCRCCGIVCDPLFSPGAAIARCAHRARRNANSQGRNRHRSSRRRGPGSWPPAGARPFVERISGTDVSAFGTLRDGIDAQVRGFGERLDGGTKAIDERAAAISTKLNDEMAK